MIEVNQIRNDYNRLYRCLMMYTWELAMIRAIANLEVACYTSCIGIDVIENALNAVKYGAYQIIDTDEDLEYAFDRFYDDIDQQDSTYLKLDVVEEVQQL